MANIKCIQNCYSDLPLLLPPQENGDGLLTHHSATPCKTLHFASLLAMPLHLPNVKVLFCNVLSFAPPFSISHYFSISSHQSSHRCCASLLLLCRSDHLEHLSRSSASLTFHLISNLHWTFIFSTLPIPLNFSLHLFALFSNINAFSITNCVIQVKKKIETYHICTLFRKRGALFLIFFLVVLLQTLSQGWTCTSGIGCNVPLSLHLASAASLSNESEMLIYVWLSKEQYNTLLVLQPQTDGASPQSFITLCPSPPISQSLFASTMQPLPFPSIKIRLNCSPDLVDLQLVSVSLVLLSPALGR